MDTALPDSRTNRASSPTTPRKRKIRRDAGQILITPRDLILLPWIAHQYAARFDQIQVLLSRYPGQPMKEELMSDAVTKDQISRWRKAGWIEYQRFLADGPGWAWLTRKGLQTFGLDAIYTSKPPAATRLHHMYAVNEIRLSMEEKKYTWISERQIRSQLDLVGKGESNGPIVDGYITHPIQHPDGKIAIEVEITQKHANDLADKLFSLVTATEPGPGSRYVKKYPAIWFYVPNESLQRTVEAARAKLRDDKQKNISVVVADLDY